MPQPKRKTPTSPPRARRAPAAPRPEAKDRAAGSYPKPTARRRSAADRAAAQTLLEILRHGGDRRDAKIRPVKSKIRTKSYENGLKLSIAIERLLASGAI